MSLVFGSAATPPPSGTNTFLQWSGSAFQWATSTSGVDASGNITPNTLTWPVSATSPTIVQTAQTSDAAAQDMTLQPQGAFATATGTNRISGRVKIICGVPQNGSTVEAGAAFYRNGTRIGTIGGSPLGSSALQITGGNVDPGTANQHNIYCDSTSTRIGGPTSGGAVYLGVNGSIAIAVLSSGLGGTGAAAMLWQQQSVTIAATGTTSLSAAQQSARLLLGSTVTLTGNITIDFGGVISEYVLDLSGLTVGANTVTVKNGTGTKAITTLLSTSTLVHVACFTANTINAI